MEIKYIAETIKNNGGNTYLVGGAIRDKFLNRKTTDEDYCVTGITGDKFLELFPEAIIKGKSFEVYELDKKEFAMARKEIKEEKGHKGFKIITKKEISIEDDLKRRDITINSIAQDVLTKEIIDPYGGRKDIEKGIIRATTEAFKEDPLRVYRVARFAAVLDFKVEKNTIRLMRSIKNELNTLSSERVFTEFRKVLLSDKPSIFFDTLKRADLLNIHFKEIEDLIGSLQPKKYHPEGDSYEHTMMVLDIVSEKTKDLQIRYSALVHDLGKGLTPKSEYPHHRGHDKKGVKAVKSLSNKICVPKSWRKCGETSCAEHMIAGNFRKMSFSKQVDFIERIDKSILGLDGLQIVVNSDREGRGKYVQSEEERKIGQFSEIGYSCLKEINGKYIIDKYNLSNEKNSEIKEIDEHKKFKELLKQERISWMKENYLN